MGTSTNVDARTNVNVTGNSGTDLGGLAGLAGMAGMSSMGGFMRGLGMGMGGFAGGMAMGMMGGMRFW